MKICSVCNNQKDFSCFSKNGKTKDGYSFRCKSCTSHYFKEYYSKNKSKIINTCKVNYQNNLEKRKEYGRNYSKQWRKYNPQYFKIYYNLNKHRIRITFVKIPIL